MLQICYEDDFCLIINKPPSMVVHHAYYSRSVIAETSLLQLIEQELNLKVYPIHRLDRPTSGLLILAKDTSYVADFQVLFDKKAIKKTYYGLVRGFSPAQITIDSPVKGKEAKEYKDAVTHLKTLASIELPIPVKPYESSRYSLVELQPETGRLHQLRIHTLKISHPLIGDGKYGDNNHNKMFELNFNASHLFLHAGKLSFTHPFTNEQLEISAKFPEVWHSVLQQFNWQQFDIQ